MRKQAILLLIGLFVVVVTVGQSRAQRALAFVANEHDVRTDSMQNRPIVPSEGPTFLTGPNSGEATEVALSYLRQNSATLGLESADLNDPLLSDQYVTEHNGVTHIYLRQRHQGIELFNGDMNTNISSKGEVISVGNRFMRNLALYANTTTPEIEAATAVERAAQQMHLQVPLPLTVLEDRGGPQRELLFRAGGISSQVIPVKLQYVRLSDSEARLTWNLRIEQTDGPHVWNLAVDAVTGELLLKYDMIIHEQRVVVPQSAHLQAEPVTQESGIGEANTTAYSDEPTPQSLSPLAQPVYSVFPLPLEHPNDGPGLPSSQTSVQNVADSVASPFGWHDIDGLDGYEFLDTRGNNVFAQEDRNDDNMDGFRPTGRQPQQFDFDYPFDPNQEPTGGDNTAAAIVNLFYLNNVIHDIAYQYGFDEVSGNYQENNYNRGGFGADAVQADAQDAFDFGITDNAFWEIAPDGVPPRMGMFVFDLTTPNRDSALDNGIVVHEYGHGISTRLVGGPANPFCLFNPESMGEGWSDWFTLALTAKPGDSGLKARPLGNYVLGESPDGPGIRRVPYSTDMSVNSQTYDWLKQSDETHAVGEVWATMLWEMYWSLVDQQGFDANLYTGDGGNNLALRLVMDGMKFTTCDPGFVDARDAILLADQINTGGANQCTIWGAFAKRGLGFSASQGSSFDTFDGREGFDLPPSCRDDLSLLKTASVPVAAAGSVLDYTLEATNYTSVTLTGLVLSDPIPAGTTYVPGSASNGGSEAGGVIAWQIPMLNPDEGSVHTFQVTVDRNFPDAQEIFFDDMEGGDANWVATGLWHLQDDAEPCGISFSPTHSWYFGQAPDCTYTDDSFGQLTTAQPVVVPNGPATLKFRSWQEFEQGFDSGSVLVSTNGTNYQAIWTTTNSVAAWQEVSIDLSDFAGQSIWLRFEFTADFTIAFRGWYVDDVQVVAIPAVDNLATVTSNEGLSASANTQTPVIKTPEIEVNPSAFEVTLGVGSTTSRTLTISNTGTAPLDFTIVTRGQDSPLAIQTAASANMESATPVQIPGFKPSPQQTPTYAGERLLERQESSYQPKVLALTQAPSNATASALETKILLLTAADVFQIQAILAAYPDLGTIDIFDARFATPTLDELLSYDTVVVISNFSFADPTAVGNVLADYVDNEGTVIQTSPSFFDPSAIGWGLSGRWLTDGYSPLIGTGDWFLEATLGSFDASHPIMQGVTAASDSFRQVMEIAPGATLVASWTDDEFVAVNDHVVALNTFLADGFVWTGDIDLILHNSILWLQDQGGEPAVWLSATPDSGTIASDATQTVDVTFDASFSEVTSGEYSGFLRIRNNDPDERTVDVPVTMTVFGPELSIISSAPTWFGRPAQVVVNFAGNGFDISATSFSVDYDENCLSFDPTDSDLDGVPDAITFATPEGLQRLATVDLSDNDGELDIFIGDTSLPLSTFEDGTLATIHFTVTCLSSGATRQAHVGFSHDPKASFSDPNGVSIPATTLPGSIEIGPELAGDCNHDNIVDSADVISCLLELFDGDGTFWLDAPGGTFPGSPQGCDSNQDNQIDAADMICTVLIIFQGQGACSVVAPQIALSAMSTAAAELVIPNAIPAEPGESVSVPIHFAGNGNEIAATAFVLSFDATRLHFDPTDGNGDGIPDALLLQVPKRFIKSVTVDEQGHIQIALADVALPLMTLADGPLATITFTTIETAADELAAISFAEDYPASVGTTKGASIPVSTQSGSVLIQGIGPAVETPEPEIPEPQAPEQEGDHLFLPVAPK